MRARMVAEIPPLAFECAKIVIAGSPFRPPNSRVANFHESRLSVRKFTLSTSFPRFYADCEDRRNRSDGVASHLFAGLAKPLATASSKDPGTQCSVSGKSTREGVASSHFWGQEKPVPCVALHGDQTLRHHNPFTFGTEVRRR